MIPYETEKEEENTEQPSYLVSLLFYFGWLFGFYLMGYPHMRKELMIPHFMMNILTML